MSWNYNNMRKSFGWKPKNNGPSFNNPQHPSNSGGGYRPPNQPRSQPFPPSSSPAPWSSNPTPPNNAYNQGNSNFMTQKSFPPAQPGYNNTFATQYNNQPGSHRSLPPTNAQLYPEQQKSRGKKTIAMVIVSVVVVIVALVAIFAGVAAGAEQVENNNNDDAPPPPGEDAPDNDPRPPNNDPVPQFDDLQLSPVETRRGNDLVGLLFENQVTEPSFNAFVRAAIRWSDILAGSEAALIQRNLNNPCNRNIGTVVSDHIRIFSGESDQPPFGAPFGTLASAGPCFAFVGQLPLVGQMTFDIFDTPRLEADGELEAVIIHEMGHVLGIGTLWPGFNLERNPLPGDVRNPDLPQPFYVGANGVAQFSIIKGSQQANIDIENGFNDRAFRQGVNGAGPGSIGGHWDKDDMDNELMTFSISNNPVLSIVSIGSLADFGYTIDLSFAERFTDPFPGQFVVSEVDAEGQRSIELINDIIPYEPITLEEFDGEL